MKPQRAQFILFGLIVVIALTWGWISLQQHQSLDQKVQDVATQVKCPICQGESIADSTTTIAQQMRTIAREQLQSGRSEQEVLQYFRDHYGNQIVLTPAWNGFALLAWLVPLALVLGGVALLVRILREWRGSSVGSSLAGGGDRIEDERELAQLSEEENALLRRQLEQEMVADDRLFKKYGTEAL
jgi:cytochrome c-type biogenesis protein CcmH